MIVSTTPAERETFQKALRESQYTLREEARRAGAAEALLQERTAALQTAATEALLHERSAEARGRHLARRGFDKHSDVHHSISESSLSTLDLGSQQSTQTRGSKDAPILKQARKHLLAMQQQQQVGDLRSQLCSNTEQLVELQQELQFVTSERDKLSLSLADSAKVRAEQQVELSQLSSLLGNLQRELGGERNVADEARQQVASLAAEKQELEVAFQSFRDHHGTGDDHKIRTITSLQLNTSHLSKEVESKIMKLGEQQGRAMELQSENRSLQERLANSELVRIKMHNSLQELQGNIRVFCRVRPALEASEVAVQVQHQKGIRLRPPGGDRQTHSFEFDRVFGPESSQTEVFAEVDGLVQSALDGYKVCIFAYGQTGAGKTHTMQGSEDPGLIPRTLRKVFQTSEEMRSQGWTWKLQASFMEVYNEGLHDLLRRSSDASSSAEHVIIRHDDWGTVVTGMTCIDVTSLDQISLLMERAAQQRSVAATDMNAASSRSHSIFAMYLTGSSQELGLELHGALHLVDLAGSERLDKSGSKGERLKETQHINRSLASLTHVFHAKADACSHVPFRSSKLTHLMEPCLSGQGKTLMLVHVQAEDKDAHETLCSLRFAAQVAQCNTGGKARRAVKQLASTVGAGSPASTQKPTASSSGRGASSRRHQVAASQSMAAHVCPSSTHGGASRSPTRQRMSF